VWCIFLSPTFKVKQDGFPEKHLVVIQCDSGHMNGDLIACARYRIYDLKVKADKEQITHVLFIIHLPHQVANSSFLGFQGSPWISSHIDDLRPSTGIAVSAQEAIGLTISELFLGKKNSQETETGGRGALEYHTAEVHGEDEWGFSNERAGNNEMPSDQESVMEKDFPRMDAESEDVEQDEVMETEATSSRQVPAQLQVVDVEEEEFGYEDISGENEEGPHLVQLPGSKAYDAQHLIEADEMEAETAWATIEENNQSVQPMLTVHATTSPQDAIATQPSVIMPNRSPLFRRLHGCIQAAASKLNDFSVKRSTKRVEILVHLIPKELPREIGKCRECRGTCTNALWVHYRIIPFVTVY
jgi:hypothetical protein